MSSWPPWPCWPRPSGRCRRPGSEPDIAGVAKKVYPSVVRVEVRNGTRRVATGVVVEKGGYVVTTALISPRDEKISITTSEGKTMDAEFLGFDTETQLALLKAGDAGLPALGAGKSSDLAPGTWICVVGVSPERTATVSQGIVSSVAADKLRLNVWVTPGSSGGPVVDAERPHRRPAARHLYGGEARRLPVPRPGAGRLRLRDEQPGRGALVGHGPGRPGGRRQGHRRPDQGEGPGRARLDGRRHRCG
ncbi:MAG: S1C family serine protease [Candidatus Moduliflexus flocculans]|nr:S1C family serine protease [Candidatus Moduliflexus flocculans]